MLFILDIQELMYHRPVPGECEHFSRKNAIPRKQKGNFPENSFPEKCD
jgi:hypothetical protein